MSEREYLVAKAFRIPGGAKLKRTFVVPNDEYQRGVQFQTRGGKRVGRRFMDTDTEFNNGLRRGLGLKADPKGTWGKPGKRR